MIEKLNKEYYDIEGELRSSIPYIFQDKINEIINAVNELESFMNTQIAINKTDVINMKLLNSKIKLIKPK